MLALHGIHKKFGPTVALDGVEIELNPGEVVAIVGENGAGKSTLLNVISGAIQPDAGTVRTTTRVAYIRQELSLFPHLTVAENIFIGAERARFGFILRERMLEQSRTLLSGFGRSEIPPDALVRDLAPASRQVVEICRALAADAGLILMDEPTSSLQRNDVDRLFAAVRQICARGMSVLYVSHFLEEVREIADRVVVLRDGRNVWSGVIGAVTDQALVMHMVGRPVEATLKTSRVSGSGESVLRTMSIESPPAVSHASLTLRRGEVLGIAGLVGSGRTELLQSLFGLRPITSGELQIHGNRISRAGWSPHKSIQHGLGYLGEDRSVDGLIFHFSVRDNITMSKPNARWGWIHVNDETRAASQQIERFRIRTPNPLTSVRRLSGGNQQKVLLARLVHQNADILLLDEPTRGVDVGSKAEIYAHIREMASRGTAILLVSSYLPELFAICDELAVMSRGRLSETRRIEEWTPESVLQTAIGQVAQS